MNAHLDCAGDPCPPPPCEEYLCPSTDKCIPYNYLCDDVVDCESGDDETGCGKSFYSFTTTKTTTFHTLNCFGVISFIFFQLHVYC